VITLLNFVLNSKKSVSGLPIILPTALFAAGLLLNIIAICEGNRAPIVDDPWRSRDTIHRLVSSLLCSANSTFKATRSVAMKVMAINSWIGWPKKVSIYSGSITAHQLSELMSTSIYRPSGGRPLVTLSNAGEQNIAAIP
jgi:hypothetical protein